MNKWLAPDSLPTSRRWMAIKIPNHPDWRMPVWGALLELTRPFYWEGDGLDIEEISEEYRKMYASRRWGDVLQPGEMVPFAGGTIPENRLLCDGAWYPCTSYPDLFAAIGYTWGGSGTTFKVPDLRGRSAIGDGTGTGLTPRAIGQKMGTETHQLTANEMPSHAHTQLFSYIIGGLGELPVPYNFLVWNYTGLNANIAEYSKGNDWAHENMPPSSVVKWLIVT